MRATSIGHAGILVETDAGSILCDPWFVPAFFGSWFVFPRNDHLDDHLLERIHGADYLYVTHLHGDHHDEPWLRRHLRRDIPVLLPGYPTREQERRMRALGFTELIRTVDGEELELASGLTVAIHVETSITDGPGGDSAMVISDGRHRIVNQNDCRTTDLDTLRAHGPVDLHWLQYSGAIWYPMVYDVPAEVKARWCADKVESQFARAMRYVETIDARAVVPSAGPPAFLDPELFHLNVITGDEPSIFPDQRSFLDRLAAAGRRGILAIPGTTIELCGHPAGDRADRDRADRDHPDRDRADRDRGGDGIEVSHPLPDDEVRAIFDDKAAYLRRYQADWMPWLDQLKASWTPASTDLAATLQAWWEPLLAMAPTLRSAVGAGCLLRAGDLEILIDFPAGRVRPYQGEPVSFRFDIARELVETVVAERAVDWSNSLFLSCRFTAWREGEFNEYLYNFFKSLSVERMRRTEAEAVRKLAPPTETEPDIELGGYVVQRRCPHRNADLSVFGEIERDELVCTLHGWRFDVHTGRCLTSADHPLRIRPRE